MKAIMYEYTSNYQAKRVIRDDWFDALKEYLLSNRDVLLEFAAEDFIFDLIDPNGSMAQKELEEAAIEYLIGDVEASGLESLVLTWFPIYLLYIKEDGKEIADNTECVRALGYPDYIFLFPINSFGGTNYNVEKEVEEILGK